MCLKHCMGGDNNALQQSKSYLLPSHNFYFIFKALQLLKTLFYMGYLSLYLISSPKPFRDGKDDIYTII